MTFLVLAALLWIGVHVGIAGTAVRGRIAARLGERDLSGCATILN